MGSAIEHIASEGLKDMMLKNIHVIWVLLMSLCHAVICLQDEVLLQGSPQFDIQSYLHTGYSMMEENSTLDGCKDITLGQCQFGSAPFRVSKEVDVSSCQRMCAFFHGPRYCKFFLWHKKQKYCKLYEENIDLFDFSCM